MYIRVEFGYSGNDSYIRAVTTKLRQPAAKNRQLSGNSREQRPTLSHLLTAKVKLGKYLC